MLTENIKEHFSQLQKQYDDLLAVAALLPEEFQEKSKVDPVYFRDIKFRIPYDLTALRQTRKQLGKEWKFQQVWGSTNPSHTYRNFAYQHPDFPGIDFWLSMDLDIPGSTCQLEEAGEEVKKIYKVVCN